MVHRLILMSKEGLIAKLAKSCKRGFPDSVRPAARRWRFWSPEVPINMPTPKRSAHGGRRAMPMACQGLSPAGLALTVIAADNRPPTPPSFVRAPGPLGQAPRRSVRRRCFPARADTPVVIVVTKFPETVLTVTGLGISRVYIPTRHLLAH